MMHPPQWNYLTFIKKWINISLTLSGAVQPIDKQMEWMQTHITILKRIKLF